MIRRAGQYWRTLRHLRAQQIVARVTRRLRRPRPADVSGATRSAAAAPWVPGIPKRAAIVDDATFEFINLRARVDGDKEAALESMPALWRYNYHYLDDLNAEHDAGQRAAFEAHLEDWLAAFPAPRGVAWDPYPASLRIVNVIKRQLGRGDLPDAWITSTAAQAEWLSRHIEWHLLGNHLFTNAKALVFAGVFFEHPRAAHWRATGLDILRRELAEQILPDGGHFERSAMYHAIMLEDVLDLINLANTFGARIDAGDAAHWRGLAANMLSWLDVMTHEDGGACLFNDAAFEIAPESDALVDYASRLDVAHAARAPGSVLLSDTGYARLESERWTLFADVAPIGPDYIPGHAHADTLTFELDVGGRRLIVDPGCSTYEDSPLRHHQRGTAAHNTVCVAGRNSSEVWSSFRVGRRTRPIDVAIDTSGDTSTLQGAHDGFSVGGRRVVHRREWQLDNAGVMIRDRLEGQFEQADAGMLLHPSVTARSTDEGVVLALAGEEVLVSATGATLEIVDAQWYPAFNRAIDTQRLRYRVEREPVVIRIRARGAATE